MDSVSIRSKAEMNTIKQALRRDVLRYINTTTNSQIFWQRVYNYTHQDWIDYALYFSDTYGPEDVNVISADVIDQIWLPILLTVGFGLPDVPKFQQNKTAIFVNGLLPGGKKSFSF